MNFLKLCLFLIGIFNLVEPVNVTAVTIDNDALVIKRSGRNCNEDTNCINRLHHDIPMTLRANPGQMIVFETRNAPDINLDPNVKETDPRPDKPVGSTVHALTGPVHIEGAKKGDTLAVTILEVRPGNYGLTTILPTGFISDLFPGPPYQVLWRLGKKWATTDAIPGVRIPNAGFPGIVTVLPDANLTASVMQRERALSEAGGWVFLPEPVNASPEELCGSTGKSKNECLRTMPPREIGGNFDVRYFKAGVTLYIPCYQDGCGLIIGDAHYAQGDGEVAGSAIEMDATVIVKTKIVRDMTVMNKSSHHYEGPSSILNIPSQRFYATTGLPIKAAGSIPPDMRYLESAKVAGLENLSRDISLAARNALIEMINYLVEQRGFTREQAYVIASVAVDLRIGVVVNQPNVVVSAVLPLDIFVDD